MTEEPERAAAGRASARGEKDKRERDLNFSDGTLALTGDAIDRAEAYRRFRGGEPKVEALLKSRGPPTR
jgi:Zn-dependent oligopeptidase